VWRGVADTVRQQRHHDSVGEVRLNQEFDVSSTKATTILVDFDGGRSLALTGSDTYMLLPVMSVVSVN
jgi:hypothetical protein